MSESVHANRFRTIGSVSHILLRITVLFVALLGVSAVMAEVENDKIGLVQGYQPIIGADGQPGIMLLVDKGGKKVREQIEGYLPDMIEQVIIDGPDDIISMLVGEAATQRRHNSDRRVPEVALRLLGFLLHNPSLFWRTKFCCRYYL